MLKNVKLFLILLLSAALIILSGCGNEKPEECGSFSLISPSDNATDIGLRPTFKWNASQNATSYKLIISENENFTGEKIEKSDIKATQYTLTEDLKNLTEYFWKVTATGEGEDNTKDCDAVFSFTTEALTLNDIVIQNYDDLDEDAFNAIYTSVQGTDGQSITASLQETAWEGMDNGKSIKISGSNLKDWGYLQVKSVFEQINVSAFDGIQFMIYPKVADERLGMILHLLNGDYPNDSQISFKIKGNAPTLVKIPFSLFTPRAESDLEEFNRSYFTGIWFTFKDADSLNLEGGFSGTYSSFEIYFDDFKTYKDDTVTAIDYQPAYKDSFDIISIDSSDAENGNITFVWSKSGAGDTYSVVIATDDGFADIIYEDEISGTASVISGIAVYTATINSQDIEMGTTYYVKMSCGETETETAEFETADYMLIDFEDFEDIDDLAAACGEGITNPGSAMSISLTGGYNNSTALKISNTGDFYIKKLWDFPNMDYFEFYYNVPSGSANFFLRLYLDIEGSNEYKKRAFVNFSAEAVRLSGSGFIRLPVSSEYMQGGEGATAEEINTLNIKGLGFYVNGATEFYIDNIKLYRESALPAQQDKLQAASVRNIMNGLEDGDYTLVVQRSYSVDGYKTLYPAVNVNFNVTSNVSDIAAADFENKITDGFKYIYTIYKQGIIVCCGRLEASNRLLINFEDYENIDDFAAACGEGITNPNSAMSISQTGGFNNSAALKISNTGDLYIKKLWDFPDFDYFEFYYNVPSGEAAFFLRFYLDTASGYTHRAYVDFDSSGLKLSGSGIIRIPISSTYLAVSGTEASNIVSSKIKGLGLYVNGGVFYIDNIKLYKESALPAAQNVTEEAAIRTIVNSMAQGSGYRLVVEKSHIVSAPHKALQPVVNAVFDVTAVGVTTLAVADFEDILPATAANYIYTIYSSDGTVLHYGTFIIS